MDYNGESEKSIVVTVEKQRKKTPRRGQENTNDKLSDSQAKSF